LLQDRAQYKLTEKCEAAENFEGEKKCHNCRDFLSPVHRWL